MAMSLMPLVGGFIALIIILGIGTIILGGSTMTCTNIAGYNSTIPSAAEFASPRANQGPHSATVGHNEAWPEACLDTNDNAVNGYSLLVISVIVFAAVIILSIVRLLG